MIVTRKKPVEQVLAMLRGVRRVALVGCASCAAACQTGGEKELEQMRQLLQEQGIETVGTVLPDECCHMLLVKRDLKPLRDSGAEAIVCLACGDGTQTVAANTAVPVFPANDTLFLGQIERAGVFREACRMCGDCMLGQTGGICPVTQCAKIARPRAVRRTAERPLRGQPRKRMRMAAHLPQTQGTGPAGSAGGGPGG